MHPRALLCVSVCVRCLPSLCSFFCLCLAFMLLRLCLCLLQGSTTRFVRVCVSSLRVLCSICLRLCLSVRLALPRACMSLCLRSAAAFARDVFWLLCVLLGLCFEVPHSTPTRRSLPDSAALSGDSVQHDRPEREGPRQGHRQGQWRKGPRNVRMRTRCAHTCDKYDNQSFSLTHIRECLETTVFLGRCWKMLWKMCTPLAHFLGRR
jgi:hypothetical protein